MQAASIQSFCGLTPLKMPLTSPHPSFVPNIDHVDGRYSLKEILGAGSHGMYKFMITYNGCALIPITSSNCLLCMGSHQWLGCHS